MKLPPDAGPLVIVRRPPVSLVCRPSDRDRLVDCGLLEQDDPAAWQVGRLGGYHGRGPCAILDLGDPDGRQVVFKMLRHGGFFGGLLGALQVGMARPLGELRVVEHLRRAGVPTPEVVFVRARRLLGPLCRLWIATRNIEGARDLAACLADRPRSNRPFESAGRLVRAMHDAGVVHADLNCRNILVAPAERSPDRAAAPSLWVIDLDRSRHRTRLAEPQRVANLERLWRSVVKSGLAERSGSALAVGRFMRGYAGADWRRWARRVAAAHARSAWRHRLAWRLTGLFSRSRRSVDHP